MISCVQRSGPATKARQSWIAVKLTRGTRPPTGGWRRCGWAGSRRTLPGTTRRTLGAPRRGLVPAAHAARLGRRRRGWPRRSCAARLVRHLRSSLASSGSYADALCERVAKRRGAQPVGSALGGEFDGRPGRGPVGQGAGISRSRRRVEWCTALCWADANGNRTCPKSARWQPRSRIGERIRWYEEPEQAHLAGDAGVSPHERSVRR
jgi:hypothetical protein